MLQTLRDEGHQLKERDLMRLRAKHGWLMRIPNGSKLLPGIVEAAVQEGGTSAAELVLHKKAKLDERQVASDERWAAKKRRRRTRTYAGIPADPPGPPRFPSETTLDEAKIILGLPNDAYRALRDQFQKMCEEEGVIKKTIAGPDKWASIKNRIVRENEHLLNTFMMPDPQKDLAQEVTSIACSLLEMKKTLR